MTDEICIELDSNDIDEMSDSCIDEALRKLIEISKTKGLKVIDEDGTVLSHIRDENERGRIANILLHEESIKICGDEYWLENLKTSIDFDANYYADMNEVIKRRFEEEGI